MRKRQRKRDVYIDPVHIDIWLTVILLVAYGLMFVFSCTSYEAANSKSFNYDAYYHVKKQAIFALIGFGVMFVSQYMNVLGLAKKLSVFVYLVSNICILLLLTPKGKNINGATRWLVIGPGEDGWFNFQVAELVKVGLILLLAFLINKCRRYLGSVKLTFYMWGCILITAAMLFRISDDLSSTIVVLCIGFGITLFNMRTWKTHLFAMILAVSAAAAYVYSIYANMPTPEAVRAEEVPFRVARIAAWIDPERYSDSAGFQPLNGLYAIGRGGLFGKGLGKSIQKYGTIPEAETDMIFTIIGEELGIVGCCVLLFLYGYLIFLLVKVAVCAVDMDTYEAVFVQGVFLHIASQSVINMMVCTTLFPNTGLPLPFISNGGTSLFILLAEMALAISIARKQMLTKILLLKRENNR